MNIAEIDRTIEKLRVSKSFDMKFYFHGDETPSCIAGHILESPPLGGALTVAQKKLEIDLDTAYNLFGPLIEDYSKITADHAIKALENLKAGATTQDELWPDFVEQTDEIA